MFQPSIEPMRPGDVIGATWLNKLRGVALEMLGLKVEAPLELVRTAGGLLLRLAWRPRFWIEITGGGGAASSYAWRDKVPAAAGAWSTGSRSGTTSVDPAYEQNGNVAVPVGVVVLARRAWGTGAVVFQLAPCNAITPAPVITPGAGTAAPSTSSSSAPPPPPPWFQGPPAVTFSGFPGDRGGLIPATPIIPVP